MRTIKMILFAIFVLLLADKVIKVAMVDGIKEM